MDGKSLILVCKKITTLFVVFFTPILKQVHHKFFFFNLQLGFHCWSDLFAYLILIQRNKNTQIYCASFFCLCCSRGTIVQNPHTHYANRENHYIMEHAKYRPLCPFSWRFQNFWLINLVGTLPSTMACIPGTFLIQNGID